MTTTTTIPRGQTGELVRYFLRLGFLDGKEGLVFHFLQGFWYRFLVDSVLYERRLKIAADLRINDLPIEKAHE